MPLISPRAWNICLAHRGGQIPALVAAACVSLLLLSLPVPTSTFSVSVVLPSSSYGTSTLMRLGVSRSTAFFNGTMTTTSATNPLSSEVGVHSAATAASTATPSLDVPRPTPNGGFTHTQRSRNKISLANKGKTPWNKGVNRSEEVKAKIAEGVRRRNRQRFLDKLVSLNMTEAQWEQHEADLKAQKEQERRQRLTAQGGYRLSNETRQKISRVLKERYATGQIQRRAVDPDKVRKGFTHSAETRAKIAESLRKRWATDDRYRTNMLRKASTSSSQEETRQKISNSLKEKWQDPEFRESMLAKMAISKGNRTSGTVTYDEDHRQRISEAMKAKWQDESYRAKTLEAIAKKRQAMMSQRPPRTSPPPQPKKKVTRPAPKLASTDLHHREVTLPLTSRRKLASRSPEMTGDSAGKNAESASTVNLLEVSFVKPLEPKQAATPRQRRRTAGTESEPDRSHLTADSDGASIYSSTTSPSQTLSSSAGTAAVAMTVGRAGGSAHTIPQISPPSKAAKKTKKDPLDAAGEKHGSVAKLKQERRDLYDLLYGDDEDEDDTIGLDVAVENLRPRRSKKALDATRLQREGDDENDEQFDFHDENLDRFDPYGLDDF
jgi:NUMOD3 motif